MSYTAFCQTAGLSYYCARCPTKPSSWMLFNSPRTALYITLAWNGKSVSNKLDKSGVVFIQWNRLKPKNVFAESMDLNAGFFTVHRHSDGKETYTKIVLLIFKSRKLGMISSLGYMVYISPRHLYQLPNAISKVCHHGRVEVITKNYSWETIRGQCKMDLVQEAM